METKKFVQKGTFSVAVLLPIMLFCIIMLIVFRHSEPFMLFILGFVTVIMAVCLLIFFRLSITVDDKNLSFELGTGMVKRRYPLDTIESCTAVRNPAWWGIGIRLTPEGWLYNVSGREAIELKFKNRHDKIRIGTDKPVEIAALVNERTGGILSPAAPEFSGKGNFLLIFLILTLAIIMPAGILISGTSESAIEIINNQIVIKGMYGTKIDLKTISSADTLVSLPPVRSRTNGFAAGNTLRGHFKLSDGRKVRLYVKTNSPPYIELVSASATVFISTRDPAVTRQLFISLRGELSGQKK
jgi:hypothetical protein